MSRQHHQSDTTAYGSTLIVLSSLFYGSYGIWTRLMGNSFGPYMQAWIRAVIVIALLFGIAIITKQRWQTIRWREDRWWLLVWCLGNWLIGGPMYYAINRLGIGLATLMFYSGYLLSMFVLGWAINHERYTPDKFLATFMALIGLYLTSAPSFDRASILPFAGALLAGAGVGIDMVVSQRIRYGSLQATSLAWATGLVGSIPMAFLLHEHVPGWHSVAWLYLLIFVMICIAASWLSIHGVKLIEAGAAGLIGLLEIVWAIFFGVAFFHERPAAASYLGAICIIVAAAIPYRKAHNTIEERIV